MKKKNEWLSEVKLCDNPNILVLKIKQKFKRKKVPDGNKTKIPTTIF